MAQNQTTETLDSYGSKYFLFYKKTTYKMVFLKLISNKYTLFNNQKIQAI